MDNRSPPTANTFGDTFEERGFSARAGVGLVQDIVPGGRDSAGGMTDRVIANVDDPGNPGTLIVGRTSAEASVLNMFRTRYQTRLVQSGSIDPAPPDGNGAEAFRALDADDNVTHPDIGADGQATWPPYLPA